ncbi:MAG: 2-C-methyl-D-erythritol 4-phosphate cytidylyltransferase, partial [Gammaproteobacteria bacterium]|nr:2-C-methyl-D-erythritol 4-phosphate cytidylyltransferase [Gammaproteobacteria bacterium]
MSVSLRDNPEKQFWAIVPAAGVGTRMQADRPKQYLELLGKTLIEHSVQRLLDVPDITGVVLALDSADTQWSQLHFMHSKPVLITNGGKERCHSVLNALRHLEQTLAQAPSPLMGEGWGGGDNSIQGFAIDTPHPNPLPQGEREGNSSLFLRERATDEVWVLVHDAARPCVRTDDLTRLMKDASLDDHGGLLALPVRDTMKRQTADGRVDTTVDRNGLWH